MRWTSPWWQTARPAAASRQNDEHFGDAARGEAMLELNRSVLPLDWLEHDDDGAAFQALRELVR